MSSMREIRDRIKSIRDIMKITNAMYLISSSKLKKARRDLAKTEPYFYKCVYAMRSILSRAPEDIDMRYFDRRKEIKKQDRHIGYIVITADKGMCGSYNHNMIKMTEKMIAQTESAHTKLYVMGTVGRLYFQRKAKAGEIDIDPEFVYTPQNPNLFRARNIAETMLKKFDEGELDELYLLYTDMLRGTIYEPRVIQLLPLDVNHFVQNEGEITKHHEAEFLPDPNTVMEHLTPNFMKGLVYGAMIESFCSEQQARMSAMDSATTSAKDMLQTLSLQYNRARQAAITQEISEVCSGANL